MAFLRGEGLNGHLCNAEGLSWTGEDPVSVDAVDKAHGQRGGLPGVGSLNGLLCLIDDFGLRFVQLRCSEAKLQGTSQFLLHYRNGLLPFALYRGNIYRTKFYGVEPLEPPRASRGDGRSLLLGEDVASAAND